MKIQNPAKNFIKCGVYGWGFECLWTGLHSIVSRENKKLTCRTSMWMFPIYGMASLIQPIHKLLKNTNVPGRRLHDMYFRHRIRNRKDPEKKSLLSVGLQ